MSETFDRRHVLKAGAAVLGGLGITRILGPAAAHAGDPIHGVDVKLGIEGAPNAGRAVLELLIDDLTFTAPPATNDLTRAVGLESGPGVDRGSLMLRVMSGTPGADELRAWADEARSGCPTRRITVDFGGRRYDLFDCYPTSYASASFDNRSPAACESIVCKMGRVELSTAAPADPPQESTFVVDILGPDGISEPDSAWETCSGGGLRTGGGDQDCDDTDPLASPRSYGDLVLRGPLTAGRKALCQWITETVQGKDWKRTVTVKEITRDGTAGRTFTYHDCFPVRYVFPAMDLGSAAPMTETVVFRPHRGEVK